ncbi:MAG TPA: histidinol-phosphate transaminase [Candidatus Corynebacterium avicola]|uniref:Aromatic amino acid aminotransferase n=1 Tax=Candidatus Corynebacterium avicola TaxID=2838527 RepID=A0A9D1RQQ1_9CORY|nr:histidinol-phosphate transaminase [Candidatus Corynebacterium avicola]
MIRADLASLPPYVPGEKNGLTVKLSSNESSQGPLPGATRAAAHALAASNRYPDMVAWKLRGSIADWLGGPSSLLLSQENIAVGAGSSALIQQAIQATCRGGDAGDEVVYPWRSFEAYPILTKVAGANPVEVPLTEDHRNDLPALAAAVTERTRLVIVCNPNNPTGTTVTREELVAFLDAVPSDVQVLLDEAYYEYVREPSSPDGLGLLADYENLAVARTFSKAYGLAGLRVGYLVGRPEFIEAVNKVSIPFSVNAVAQAAAVASIEAKDELLARTDDTVTQRARVLEALPEQYRIDTQANFVWLDLGERAREFTDAIAEYGIAVRCFDGEGVRITVTDEAETDVLVQALHWLSKSIL